MDVEELLTKAWAAVKASGVPAALQPIALAEAIAFLRANQKVPLAGSGGAGGGSGSKGSSVKTAPRVGDSDPASVDEDDFFGKLAHESGVSEADLRDLITLGQNRSVILTAPTKNLGKSGAEQARTITVLVAGARSVGLGEKPVSADAVREEVKRKGCFQVNNYASKSLGPLKGFNYGASSKDMVLTSKWVGEFVVAVALAHGRKRGDTGD